MDELFLNSSKLRYIGERVHCISYSIYNSFVYTHFNSLYFFSLAMEPSLEVRSYNGCIVGGVRFHTLKRDSWCTTQNSGVIVVGEGSGGSGGGVDNYFYCVLDEVLHAQYPFRRHAWLFKCRWFDTYINKNHRMYHKLGYKSINTFYILFIEEPVILATHAYQVFYLEDPKNVTN